MDSRYLQLQTDMLMEEQKFKQRIFIVDDDPFCLATYEKHLQEQGYEDITCFSSGRSFLHELPQRNPEIVLLDYDLGDMSGLEVLKLIKLYNRGIFVVFASSEDQRNIAAASLKGGAFEFISKDNNILESITNTLNTLYVLKDFLRKKDWGGRLR